MEKTLLDIVLILICTKIGGIISRKLKMPEVLGALIAGVILGPVVLNVVQYDDNIKLLSNLGVIMLMFLAGIETNIEELKISKQFLPDFYHLYSLQVWALKQI